ncbi:MAG: hypothetical protein KDH16_11465 [Rhodocyclaceae bacterium]|nr:hypothetical protein [Rhodocyclaceae bacterium]
MQITIRENDEPAVLGAGVLARLFFTDERVLVRGLGFEDEQRKPFFVQ